MSGLYIHIPFCDTKCIYCDFYSITNHSQKDNFLKCLNKEIASKAEAASNHKFDTIFFGGGTPSLLEAADFRIIFDTLYKHYSISPESEITIEANPGTLNAKKLREFKSLPINRISMGVQTFIESELKFLTRIHSSTEAIDAIKSAQDAGFVNLNLDLIFALPNQTLENWNYNLEKAVSLGIKHISAYSLIFEEGTFLNALLFRNQVKKADIDLEHEMLEYTMNFLPAHGFNQYEISNYALSGYECRHNLKYWEYDDYFSFGPSASSFAHSRRWTNIRDINKYIARINANEDPMDFNEDINRETSIAEFIFLALRSKGIDINKYNNKFDDDFCVKYDNTIDFLTGKGFAELSQNSFKLTKKGYALCDEIVATYF